MNAKKEILEDISTTISKGLSKGIIMNPRKPMDEGNKITCRHTRFTNEEDYCARCSEEYEDNNYLFTMEDGSYFQANFEFKIRSSKTSFLTKQTLCFLPSISETTHKPIHCYLRLDYDSEVCNSFFHSQAHLHVGLGNDLRIPVDNILKLSDFLEFVLYLFYEDKLQLWRPELKTEHTISDSSTSLTQTQILANELKAYFYLHQKTTDYSP